MIIRVLCAGVVVGLSVLFVVQFVVEALLEALTARNNNADGSSAKSQDSRLRIILQTVADTLGFMDIKSFLQVAHTFSLF
jgi:hypothetical protein